MEKEYTVSEELQQELQWFLNYNNVALLNQNMRRMLLDFLDYELRTGVPLYFDTFLYSCNCLLDFLDKAAREIDAFEAGKIKTSSVVEHSTKGKVLAFLKATLSPEKIYLLHQETGTDNQEHFDLLVVIPDTSQTGFNQYEQVISMANIEKASIQVSLHQSAALRKQLEEGHVFYTLACTETNLVYDNGTTNFPPLPKEVLQTVGEKVNNAFSLSHKKAGSFLQGASSYYGENDKEMAAFMLQQAVELVLRGLITALLGYCPKTHCLNDLKKPLKRCVPEFGYLFSEDEAEENRLVQLLQKAYLEARYTDKFAISDNDFTLLTEGAENLYEEAEAICRKRIEAILKNL